MILHQRPFRNIYATLSLKNSTFVTAYTILWCKKSYFQLMIFVQFPIKKLYFSALSVPPLYHLPSCTPIKSHLYLANSLVVAVSEPALYRLLTFQLQNLMSLFSFLRSYQSINPSPKQEFMFRKKDSFYCEALSTPLPTPKFENQPLSAVRYCLFNILATTLHIGGRSSKRNLKTCHAGVAGTHLSRTRGLVHLILISNQFYRYRSGHSFC